MHNTTKLRELQELFVYLIKKHGRSSVELQTPFPCTILDLYLDGIHIMPRIANKVVSEIAKNALRGDLTSMYTLSQLYTVGMGLPKNMELAYTWAQHSLLETGTIEYSKAVATLKKHVRSLPANDFSYPRIVENIYSNMIQVEELDPEKPKLPKGQYWLAPSIAGVKLTLVYRVDDQDNSICYLYDVRAEFEDGERISLDIAQLIDIPFTLGSVRNSQTLPDYAGRWGLEFKQSTDYIVVTGTLAIKPGMKSRVREFFPDVTKSSQLFEELVNSQSTPRIGYVNTKEFDVHREKMQKVSTKIQDIESGELTKRLRVKYDSAVAAYRSVKGNKLRAKAAKEKVQAIVEENQKIKSPKYLRYASRVLKNLDKEFVPIKEENDTLKQEHLLRYPEAYFTFMATHIYSGKKGSSTPLPVGRHIYKHLQALGFRTFNHHILTSSESSVLITVNKQQSLKTFKRVFNKFVSEFDGYTVTGLSMSPANSPSIFNISM